jgi:hypothetical protein
MVRDGSIPRNSSLSSSPSRCPARSAPALAQDGSVLTTLENQVVTAAKGWETTVMNAARSLFWILAGIEIGIAAVWLAINAASLDSWFAELVRRIMFIGLFAFILDQGPTLRQGRGRQPVPDRRRRRLGLAGQRLQCRPLRRSRRCRRRRSSACSRTMRWRSPPCSPWSSSSSPSAWSPRSSSPSWSRCMSACSPA